MTYLTSGGIKKQGRDKEIQVGKSSPPWMVTYSDLMTQLLIFFVMMFALAATLNELQLKQIKKRLEKYAYEQKLDDVILLEINTQGLVISLNERLMFDSGRAGIYEEAKKILSDISEEIIDIPNNIRIEGHTDSVPIKNEKFPSNWELSTTRATNVARFLIEALSFPAERVSAGGYSKYHPAVFTDYDDKILEYKEKVKRVPSKYAEELNRAKTDQDREKIHMEIRKEQFSVQMEMREVIDNQLKVANQTAGLRSLNRRVDIIVQRISSGVKKAAKKIMPDENSG